MIAEAYYTRLDWIVGDEMQRDRERERARERERKRERRCKQVEMVGALVKKNSEQHGAWNGGLRDGIGRIQSNRMGGLGLAGTLFFVWPH